MCLFFGTKKNRLRMFFFWDIQKDILSQQETNPMRFDGYMATQSPRFRFDEEFFIHVLCCDSGVFCFLPNELVENVQNGGLSECI